MLNGKCCEDISLAAPHSITLKQHFSSGFLFTSDNFMNGLDNVCDQPIFLFNKIKACLPMTNEICLALDRVE
jgi:hypothetical protein